MVLATLLLATIAAARAAGDGPRLPPPPAARPPIMDRAVGTTFDGAMLECNQAQDVTTQYTYGKNLDACMITAGNAMDDCRTSCSSRCD